jgi:hypothetical protein
MIAYKFTHANRQPIYGASDYPPLSEWSESRTPVICQSGWHVPTPGYLSTWLNVELWEVEVQGLSVSTRDKSAYEQIRFVRQIVEWSMPVYVEFANFCAEQAKRYSGRSAAAYADAADAAAAAAAAAYAYAADAAAAAAAAAAYAYAYAAAAARKEQSDWLRNRLGLVAAS